MFSRDPPDKVAKTEAMVPSSFCLGTLVEGSGVLGTLEVVSTAGFKKILEVENERVCGRTRRARADLDTAESILERRLRGWKKLGRRKERILKGEGGKGGPSWWSSD